MCSCSLVVGVRNQDQEGLGSIPAKGNAALFTFASMENETLDSFDLEFLEKKINGMFLKT